MRAITSLVATKAATRKQLSSISIQSWTSRLKNAAPMDILPICETSSLVAQPRLLWSPLGLSLQFQCLPGLVQTRSLLASSRVE